MASSSPILPGLAGRRCCRRHRLARAADTIPSPRPCFAGNGVAAPINPQLLEVLQSVANGGLTPDDGAVQLGQLVGQSRLGQSGVAVERAAFPEVWITRY